MAVDSPSQRPSERRSRFVWFPVGLLAIYGAGMAYLWNVPGDDLEFAIRLVLSVFSGALVAALLLVWVTFFSALAVQTRLLVLVAVAGLIGAFVFSIEQVSFTGDMVPTIFFRGQTAAGLPQLADRAKADAPTLPVALSVNPLTDCVDYRGPARDGVIPVDPQHPIDWDWKANKPVEKWRQKVGEGYAAFTVLGPFVVTIEQKADSEAVIALDRETGKQIWSYQYPARFSEAMGGDGPRATPVIAGDAVYALGATGLLTAVELKTGKKIWETNILADAEAVNLTWGMSGSPLVVDKLVVVNPGINRDNNKKQAIIAYDRVTGGRVWSGGSDIASYSSPMLATLHDTRQILVFDSAGLTSYDLANGDKLWQFAFVNNPPIVTAQPLVIDQNRVLIAAGYAKGAAVVEVSHDGKGWSAKEVWQNRSMRCKFTSPVVYQGFAYGLDEGILVCVDLATGKRRWKSGRYGHGQLLLAGNELVIQAENGDVAVVDATPEAFVERARLPVLRGEKTWNNPTLAGNQLFVRNHREMVRLDLPVKGAAAPSGEQNR